ncbi:MAG: hypothetical protein KZQ80_02500 [Candidatus Thiodiazotropha sp. (ex Monitilora ramsayi)]|nr:hypothetical protein [Candidatus Thiodiazotropha sp. (ex Monitilora ramsayi)]
MSNKNTFGYASRLIAMIPIWLSLISGISIGAEGWDIDWVILGIGCLVSMATFLYWKSASKPFAEINGEKLILNSVTVEKSKVKHMVYRINNSSTHELEIDMEGFNDWKLSLTNEDVELDGIPLYKFIRENFYPIELVESVR